MGYNCRQKNNFFCSCCCSEDKKGNLQDVANQKGVVCRAQGWKIHLCAAQLVQLVRNWSLGQKPSKTITEDKVADCLEKEYENISQQIIHHLYFIRNYL